MNQHLANGHADNDPSLSTSTAPRPFSRAVFVVPFAVFMLFGMLEPSADKPFSALGFEIDYASYPIVYTLKIVATVVSIFVVSAGYLQFPLRVSPLAPLVGVVGVVLWIAICKLQIESRVLGPLGLDQMIDLGRRAAFNPLAEMADRPALAYGFLAIRFLGLAAVVPLIEEFFLRGFIMRFVIDADWWKVPFGTLTPIAIAAGTIVPVLMHPAEMVAAAVWFTMITWLMFKTRNIWDCVVAHAVTNLLLGVWVVATDDWTFL